MSNFSELKTFNRSGAVCKFLNISRNQFYHLRDTGQLPAPYRIGGADMWSRDDLIAWLESTRQVPAKAPNSDNEAVNHGGA